MNAWKWNPMPRLAPFTRQTVLAPAWILNMRTGRYATDNRQQLRTMVR